MAELPHATDIPWAEELMLVAKSYLTVVVDESSAVDAGLLTMVADKHRLWSRCIILIAACLIQLS